MSFYKMRRLGENSYYKEFLRPKLNEILGDTPYKIEHVNGKRKCVIHTDRADDTQIEAVSTLLPNALPKNICIEQYNHHIDISWQEINKYVTCTTFAEMHEVEPDKIESGMSWGIPNYYIRDFTSDGDFVYPLPELLSVYNPDHSAFSYLQCEKFVLRLPKATDVRGALWGVSYRGKKVSAMELHAPNAIRADGAGRDNYSRLKSLKLYVPKAENINSIARDNQALEEFDCDFSSASTGVKAFELNKFTPEMVKKITDSIPSHSSGSHPLMLGIHVDYQTDEVALTAIADAEAKGWELTVQWNGTPTAQTSATYGLRKPPIYARDVELDGKRELEWGHYVTNPEDYQEFSSLEEARDYFGLPVENEELNNSEP